MAAASPHTAPNEKQLKRLFGALYGDCGRATAVEAVVGKRCERAFGEWRARKRYYLIFTSVIMPVAM